MYPIAIKPYQVCTLGNGEITQDSNSNEPLVISLVIRAISDLKVPVPEVNFNTKKENI